MYNTHLFSKFAEVNGNYFNIVFLPDFRQDVTMYDEKNDYYVSEGNSIKKEKEGEYTWISIPKDASWLLVVKHWQNSEKTYELYATSRTREVETPLGAEINRTINTLLKQARFEYNQGKNKELRLYFFNSEKERLNLIEPSSFYYAQELDKYSLYRPFHYNTIDRQFDNPTKNCFILGRVRKTIGTKNKNLHDFIEPVSQIFLDFERNEKDFFDNYNDKVMELQNVLMTLLCYTIKKKHSSDCVETKRIKAYIDEKKDANIASEEAIKVFTSEINIAFQNGDTNKLRALYQALNRKQDCSKERFSITTVHQNIKTVFIKYENGEQDFVDIDWVKNNQYRCTN